MVRGAVARLRYRLIEQVVLPRLSNLSVNRRFWDRYARAWDARNPYLDVDLEGAERENYIAEHISVLGDEWGTPGDVATVLEDFVYPSLRPEHNVVEIGVGGGRVASAVAPRVAKLYGFDISPEMLKRAREAVPANVELVLLRSPELPRELAGTIDFAYAFDVFLHLDLHTQWRYLVQLHGVLKPRARALVHTTNLRAAGGWDRFAQQWRYDVRGHYFVIPELVDLLAERAGFVVVQRSEPTDHNFYYARDYLALVEKLA
jgi:SAM-dependent methyltransferase